MKKKFSKMGRVAIALVLASSLILVMAVPVSAVDALSSVTVTPSNTMAGATADYPMVITTAGSGDIATIDMTFATAFDVSAAAFKSKSGTIGTGTVSVSGQVVTYTVNTPVSVNAGEMTITLSGIVNPSAATYTPGVTVTTKNLAGGALETGSVNVTITAAPVSFSVVVVGGAQTAGDAFSVIVTALKADGLTTETQYTGDHLIGFTSTASDPKTIPAFEVVDFGNGGHQGVGTTSASFVLNVVETGRTITATDSVLSVTGTSDPITVNLAGTGYITITGAPASVTAGEAFADDITVTAYDAAGNVMTSNTTDVVWASTAKGTTGSLPADHALEAGTWTFAGSDFALETSGVLPKTIIATVGGSDAGSSTILVSAAAASKLSVVAATSPIDANGYDSSVITATVQDEFDNTVIASTAAITFETSIGGFTQASGASTYIKNAVLGVATPATLTSTDGGEATVRVTSGSLTYDIVAVTLTPNTAPLVVWVDDDYSSDADDGGHDWDYDAFDTIELGIGAVAAGGTVNVLPGTYTPAGSLEITTNGLTLKSTDGTAVTIIDVRQGSLRIQIRANDVTIDGFTVKDTTGGSHVIKIVPSGSPLSGIKIQNNVITGYDGHNQIAIAFENHDTSDVTIANNVIQNVGIGIFLGGGNSDIRIVDNTITGLNYAADGAITFGGSSLETSAITVSGNTISDNAGGGIVLGAWSSEAHYSDIVIEDNIISGNDKDGIEIRALTTGETTGLTITRNDIIDNALDGILIASWDATNAINNNNIVGNAGEAINNTIATVSINAENNWWGDATGPFHATTNPDAKGFLVGDDVDYTPWLTEPYVAPADPVTGISLSLSSGWNLISLPIIPTSSVIATVLADLITADTALQVRTYDQGAWYNWASTGPAGNLTIMEDGAGYWIEMDAADTLVVTGSELPAPPLTPPSYNVYTGWNMIGFKSVATNTTVAAYLGPLVAPTLEAIYGYDAAAGAYFIPGVTPGHDFLEPGSGYWLAVNANGTIYP